MMSRTSCQAKQHEDAGARQTWGTASPKSDDKPTSLPISPGESAEDGYRAIGELRLSKARARHDEAGSTGYLRGLTMLS
jgi:hypothetical protein